MPAKSPEQRDLFAIAEHNPSKLYSRNRGLADLPKQTLHDFASTKNSQMKTHADSGTMPVKRRYQFVGHNGDASVEQNIFPGGHQTSGAFHQFAKTTGPTRFTDEGAAPEKWAEGAVKRPGALTKKANAAGMAPMSFARRHYNSPGLTGSQSRFAVNINK